MLQEVVDKWLNEKSYSVRGEMCDIFKGYNSDKSTWHNYTTLYSPIFDALGFKYKPINLFELGLGSINPGIESNMGHLGKPGASMYGFRDLLPLANIYGADIDKDISLQEDRIKTFYCDQTDPDIIKNMWNLIGVDEFDVIIDDGLHKNYANECFFENSYHKVKKGGLYVIEDISNNDYDKTEAFLKKQTYTEMVMLKLPMEHSWTGGLINTHDNTLALIIK
jgi:SAM-dependent methyltransferase